MLRPQFLLPLAALLATGFTPVLRGAEIDAEDYRNLKSRVAAFDESIASYRGQIQRLQEEAARLRSENEALKVQAAASRNAVSRDQLTRLAGQIQEVERNRTRDKQQVLDALDRLRNLAAAPSTSRTNAAPQKAVTAARAAKKTPRKPPAPTASRKPSATTSQ